VVVSYAFEVPARYAAQFASGEIVRFGALLKDSVSGRVVAHLQETGAFQQILSQAGALPFSPVSVLNTVSSIGANIQLHKLTHLVQSLQLLQVATLGISIAGVGVSVIGFAMMNKKLNALSDQISTLSARIDSHFKEQREREFRAHFSKLRGLCDQADQAMALSNPIPELLRLAPLFADESAFLRGELAHYINTSVFEPDLFQSLTLSYSLCNSGRIQCLLLAGELRGALRVSEDDASSANELFDRLRPIHLAKKLNPDPSLDGKPGDINANRYLWSMQDFVMNVRDIQDCMNSKPFLIETLMAKKVDGFEYLNQLRQQKDEPLLLMAAT
jgi:hypothetical protein